MPWRSRTVCQTATRQSLMFSPDSLWGRATLSVWSKTSRIFFAEIDAQTLGASPVVRVLPFRLIDILLSHEVPLIQFLAISGYLFLLCHTPVHPGYPDTKV